MTALASTVTISPARSPASRARIPLRTVVGRHGLLLALLAGGATVGVAAGAASHPAALPEPTLVLLLRFMAALKGLTMLAAAGLALWRLCRPAGASAVAGYGAGLALMAVAPGLVWSLAHVAAGAACFHGGLLVFAVTAARDDALVPSLLRRRGRLPGLYLPGSGEG